MPGNTAMDDQLAAVAKSICGFLFRCFEGKSNSTFGKIVLFVLFTAILTGLVSMIMSTDPKHTKPPLTCDKPACHNDPVLCPGYMICEPVPNERFQRTNNIVTIVFICDYFVRLFTVWAVDAREADCLPYDWDATHAKTDPIPVYSTHVQTLRFLCGSGTNIFRNCVDLAAILPYFIHLAVPTIELNNNFVRVLRLVRVFGIMNRQKEVKVMLNLIIRTVIKSSYALGVLMLLSLVLIVFFGSVMYALESGHFVVSDDFPTGQYVRTAYSPTDGKAVLMASPYNSIGVTMYYVITTITTVGYGDLFPTTAGGRFLANVIMYSGIIGLALPIGVISSNFSEIFNEYMEQKLLEKEDDTNASLSSLDQKVSQAVLQKQSYKDDYSVGNVSNAATHELQKMLIRRLVLGAPAPSTRIYPTVSNGSLSPSRQPDIGSPERIQPSKLWEMEKELDRRYAASSVETVFVPGRGGQNLGSSTLLMSPSRFAASATANDSSPVARPAVLVGSIPATLGMLQLKMEELASIKREWDETIWEMEELLQDNSSIFVT